MNNKKQQEQKRRELYECSVFVSLLGTFVCLILSLLAERDPESITTTTIGNPDAWVCLALLSLSYFVYGMHRLTRY